MSRKRVIVTTAVAVAAFLSGGWFMQQGGRRDETVNPLRGAAVQLLSTIQSSVKLAASQTGAMLPEPNRYVLLGGAMALPGLVPYLQAGLRKPVELFHQESIFAETSSVIEPLAAMAYGPLSATEAVS